MAVDDPGSVKVEQDSQNKMSDAAAFMHQKSWASTDIGIHHS